MIPIFEPYLKGNEAKYINRCLDTNWISSQGDFILRFEKGLSKYHGMRYTIATSSCTTALHISLKALEIGAGDEVICPDLTFIAPANMIVLSGAKLTLVDIDPITLDIDPDKIEDKITDKTKAIIVVHQFGHAAPMDEIQAIANRYSIKIIEDNAESIGGSYKGRLLGTISDIATLSFFANKIITCGEGGAILTNNAEIADRCRVLRDHGMSREKKYHHVELGYNYRMTNMQAAIGLAQLEKLNEILEIRKKQMKLYYKLLDNTEGIKLRSFKDWCDPVHWMLTLKLDKKYKLDKFFSYMKAEGIDCRQMINPVHRADHFVNDHDDKHFPNSISASTNSAHLPSSTSLSEDQIYFIVNKVKNFVEKF